MSKLNRRDVLASMLAAAATGTASADQQSGTLKRNARSRSFHGRRASDGWVATWVSGTTKAPDSLRWQWDRILDAFESQTLRQCIFTSVGGSAVRIRISNRYGEKPLRIATAALGVKRKGIAYDAE